MSLSNAVENEMLVDFLTRHPDLYLAASTADPGEDGSTIAEPVGGGYARAAVGAVTVTGSIITNDAPAVFPKATADWGTITHVAVYDAAEAGAFLGSVAVLVIDVATNDKIVVPTGTTIVTLD